MRAATETFAGEPVASAAALLGTSVPNVYAYTSGRLRPGPGLARRIQVLECLTESEHAEVRGRLSASALAALLRRARQRGERFQVRWVAQFLEDVRRVSPGARRFMLAEPSSTGRREHDALLAGAVALVCEELGEQVPDWAREPGRRVEPLTLLGAPEGFYAYALAHTPPALKSRGVLVPREALVSL